MDTAFRREFIAFHLVCNNVRDLPFPSIRRKVGLNCDLFDCFRGAKTAYLYHLSNKVMQQGNMMSALNFAGVAIAALALMTTTTAKAQTPSVQSPTQASTPVAVPNQPSDTTQPVEPVVEPVAPPVIEPAPVPRPEPKPEPKKVVKKGPVDSLKPGQFVWEKRVAYANPLRMVVVLDIQRMYVFDGDELVGFTTVSSGKKGKETPSGIFKILQKKVYHESNLYANAPMPFMQRLTWDGIALHAGHNPGYPASHGCIRLPKSFAQSLYDATVMDAEVVILESLSKPLPKPKPAPAPTPVAPVDPVPTPVEQPVATSPLTSK